MAKTNNKTAAKAGNPKAAAALPSVRKEQEKAVKTHNERHRRGAAHSATPQAPPRSR